REIEIYPDEFATSASDLPNEFIGINFDFSLREAKRGRGKRQSGDWRSREGREIRDERSLRSTKLKNKARTTCPSVISLRSSERARRKGLSLRESRTRHTG